MMRLLSLLVLTLVLVAAATADAGSEASPDLTPNTTPDAAPDVTPVVAGAASAAEAGPEAGFADFVDGVVLGLRHEHSLPAVTVAVVKDDTLLLARAYGESDIGAMRAADAEETLFRIGSVSKTFIWTAVMMLDERGLLDLDTDVNQYLRDVRVNEGFGTPVTLRDLMHHRAGFEDSMRLFAVRDDDPRSRAEVLAAHQPARVFAPGTRTSYSNWGSALAAQVVEDVAGEPYGDFLRREILDPLRMHATTWTPPAQFEATERLRLATGYRPDQGALAVQGYMQLGPYWPAGGLASTAADMARWMRFHLNGGTLDGVRLMQADTHARMWTRGFNDRPDASDVAHGFQDRPYRGLRLLGHGGGTAAFLTGMVLAPELALGVFVSQSTVATGAAIEIVPARIVDRFAGFAPQVALRVTPGAAGPLAEYAGTYLNNRRVRSSFAAVLGLQAVGHVTPLSADALLVTAGPVPRQFRPVEGRADLFEAADGGRLTFLRDGRNRVAALVDTAGVHTAEKVGPLETPMTLLSITGAAMLLAVTTLLGFWWRLRRRLGGGFASRVAATIALFAAVSVLLMAGVGARLAQGLAQFDISTLPGNYPVPAMLHLHYSAWAVAGAAAAMLVGLWPAWSGSGWTLWRRLHFSGFALVLLLLVCLMWHWRLIGAPVY